MSESATPPPDLAVVTPETQPLHVEPVAPVETAPVPEPALEPYPPSLLELATPKPTEPEGKPELAPEPEKPVEAKPAEPEVKSEPEVKPPEPPPEVKYEFKLPEGFTAPKEALDGYTGVLKETGVAPEVGQRLLDMHLAEVQRLTDAQPAQWRAAFVRTMQDLVSDVLKDPQLGGAGHQTAMTAAARGRDSLIREWTPEQKAELEPFLANFGVGNHKVFLRLLYSAARLNDEPAPPSPVQIPPPTNGTRPGAGFKALYDHPGSAARSR